MEQIEGLENFPLMDFSKTSGTKFEAYYAKKNSKLRMYDENHVIKASGDNLEFLKRLELLNIEQVNSPIKILQDKFDMRKYYIVSKYLDNYLELSYCNNNFLLFAEVLDYFIQILTILEECHQNSFYVGDIHSSNILISPDKKAFLFDFDKSFFLDDKIIGAFKDLNLYTIYEIPIIKNILKYTYGVNEEYLSFYNSNIELLKPFFIENDKEFIIREIINLLFWKFYKDEREITKYDIKKLTLSRSLEKKLIDCLINNNPLYTEDYLIAELNELKESKLVRKKLNNN